MSPPPCITHFGKMSDVSNDFDRAVNFLQGAECPPPVRNPILWYQLVANLHGTILKAYPGKVGGKPLKDLFRE